MPPSFFPPPPPNPAPKLNVSTGTLPPYISPSQPPTKKSPFRQIQSVPFVRSATLILPEELHQLIVTKLENEPSLLNPRYAKVICPLGDLLEGKFFNDCVKRPGSNILALSEGVPGVDDRFLFREGKLVLDLGKESYEKA